LLANIDGGDDTYDRVIRARGATPELAESANHLWRCTCVAHRLLSGSQRHKTLLSTLNKGYAMWQKLLFVFMSLLSLSLTACNTIEGAGKDVQGAGREVSEEAREHRPK
jgi:entericidin B